MARPRRSDATRKQLLVTGIQLFSVQGYHGTGVKQVLDEVGVPKGSFYNFFTSKENFGAEVVRYYIEWLANHYEGVEAKNPIEKLYSIHKQLVIYLNNNPEMLGCLLGNLASEVGGQSGELQDAIREGFDCWYAYYSALFQEAKSAGLIRQDIDTTQLAKLFITQWQGGLQRYQLDNDSEQLMQSLELIITLAQ